MRGLQVKGAHQAGLHLRDIPSLRVDSRQIEMKRLLVGAEFGEPIRWDHPPRIDDPVTFFAPESS